MAQTTRPCAMPNGTRPGGTQAVLLYSVVDAVHTTLSHLDCQGLARWQHGQGIRNMRAARWARRCSVSRQVRTFTADLRLVSCSLCRVLARAEPVGHSDLATPLYVLRRRQTSSSSDLAVVSQEGRHGQQLQDYVRSEPSSTNAGTGFTCGGPAAQARCRERDKVDRQVARTLAVRRNDVVTSDMPVVEQRSQRALGPNMRAGSSTRFRQAAQAGTHRDGHGHNGSPG